MIGHTISHYRILEKLGEGGMGVVYKAEDTRLKRTVALKLLPAETTGDTDAKARFIREAQAASTIDHPNVCTVFEVDESIDGTCFIAMAYYQGESLQQKIAQNPLTISEALDFAIQISNGLKKAHESGIVHRDIKPANVIITSDGTAKILDFGLAKLRGRSKLTKENTSLGTISYMSPEQARGEEVDARTDIWSLGCVFYEMLIGRSPFTGDYEQGIVYSILNTQPEPVTALRSGVPMEFERIVKKCLEKDTDERYQTTADLIADLKHLQKNATLSTAPQAETKLRRKQKPQYWMIAAGIGIIVIVALSLWRLFLNNSNDEHQSIAVLPFANLSENQEEEYFSDGVAEDIRTHLSKIADLRVISQQGVLRYKNSKASITDIGRELDVTTILEGSVRRVGNKIRIVAQLINAKGEGHLWAETYDKEMKDIFSVQSDIAEQITNALRIVLTSSEKLRIETPPTSNLTAYDYYLRGRDFYYRYQREDNTLAMTLFKKAIEIDSTYALAYAGVADAYAKGLEMRMYSPNLIDSAEWFAQRSIALNPSLAEGHKARAFVYSRRGWYRKSLEELRLSLTLNPNYYPAVSNIGMVLGNTGDLVGGIQWNIKATKLGLLTIPTCSNITEDFIILGDDSCARIWYRKGGSVGLDTLFAAIRIAMLNQQKDEVALLGNAVFKKYPDKIEIHALGQAILGNFEESKNLWKRYFAIDSNQFFADYGYACWKSGDKLKAQELFHRQIAGTQRLAANGSEREETRYEAARACAMMGRKDETMKWLREAVDLGFRNYRWMQVDPLLENIRTDPQFRQLVLQIKTITDEQRKRVQEMIAGEIQ
jgi:serine/threonine protein kinase